MAGTLPPLNITGGPAMAQAGASYGAPLKGSRIEGMHVNSGPPFWCWVLMILLSLVILWGVVWK